MMHNQKVRLGFLFLILAIFTKNLMNGMLFFNGLFLGLSITFFIFGLIENRKKVIEQGI